MTRIHKHEWPLVANPVCRTCGMTRGRAARAAQDRNTILKFLRSAEVGIALHQAKLDPVLYATVMSRLTNVADAIHEATVAKATAGMGRTHSASTAPKPIGRVIGPAVTLDGTVTATVVFDEA